MKKPTKKFLIILSVTISIFVSFSIGTKSGLQIGRLMGLWESDVIKQINQNDTSKLTLEEYRAIWETEGLSPELHAKSAFFILSELGNTNIYLTPGNVIQILGNPSGSNVNGYQGIDAPRLTLWFKSNKLFLDFSMLGPLESVLYEVGHERQSGWGLSEDYPVSIPESDWTVISGVFDQAYPPNNLIAKAESFAKELQTESEWYPVVMKHFKDYPPPDTPNGLDISCESHMILVDGLRDDLARITFSIKGKHEYWCDTWWHLEDSQWLRLPPHEGAKLIAEQK